LSQRKRARLVALCVQTGPSYREIGPTPKGAGDQPWGCRCLSSVTTDHDASKVTVASMSNVGSIQSDPVAFHPDSHLLSSWSSCSAVGGPTPEEAPSQALTPNQFASKRPGRASATANTEPTRQRACQSNRWLVFFQSVSVLLAAASPKGGVFPRLRPQPTSVHLGRRKNLPTGPEKNSAPADCRHTAGGAAQSPDPPAPRPPERRLR
jgi:hypothetical protein